MLFKDEEDTLALVFQHINPEDAGLYTCVASTSTGKISCSAELSVDGGMTQLLKVRNDCGIRLIEEKIQSVKSSRNLAGFQHNYVRGFQLHLTT